MDPNSHYEFAKQETEKWISKFIHRPWTDKQDLVGWAGYTHLNCKDPEKLSLIAKIDTWGFMLDDYLDKNRDKIDDWIKILAEEKILGNHPLEKMFEDFMPQIKPHLTYFQHQRFMAGWMKLVMSYIVTDQIKSGEIEVSLEEHMQLRFSDSARDAMFVHGEYGLGIVLDRFWDLESFKLYHDYASKHALIFNDLISFEKEYLEDGGKYNYIYILSKKMKCSFQEAADYAAKELSAFDIKILHLRQNLLSITNKIPVEYLDEIMNFKDGNVFWSQNSKRYN